MFVLRSLVLLLMRAQKGVALTDRLPVVQEYGCVKSALLLTT